MEIEVNTKHSAVRLGDLPIGDMGAIGGGIVMRVKDLYNTSGTQVICVIVKPVDIPKGSKDTPIPAGENPWFTENDIVIPVSKVTFDYAI